MSYILDAIRKAEKQRQEETVPSLETMVLERKQKHLNGGKRWLVWGLLAIVLGMSWYLNKEQVNRWLGQGTTTLGQWYQAVESGILGLVGMDEGTTDNARGDSGLASTDTTESQATSTALTPAQRRLLQQIRFSVISYSTDPNKRFAMVGGDTLREGDSLEGFPITRIRKDGVMLDVNGRAVLIRP